VGFSILIYIFWGLELWCEELYRLKDRSGRVGELGLTVSRETIAIGAVIARIGCSKSEVGNEYEILWKMLVTRQRGFWIEAVSLARGSFREHGLNLLS